MPYGAGLTTIWAAAVEVHRAGLMVTDPASLGEGGV